MDETRAEKVARNDSVFRDANEQIAAAAADLGVAPEFVSPFICECSDPRCVQVIRLTLDAYRHVRSNPRWFAHAIGHETIVDGIVRPVEEHDGYTIVEKIGAAGEVAAQLASERKGV
jgi:hypothetical protein